MTVQLLRGGRDAPPDDGRDRAAGRWRTDARRGSTGALAAISTMPITAAWRQLAARRMLGNDASAEDLVRGDFFELLPRALRRFQGAASLETFLFAMVVNRTRQHLRGAIRRRRALERLGARAERADREPGR